MIRYSRAFFELQWQFAERVAVISGMPREQALMHYTNFYIRFGLGRQFDANHDVWRIYIDGLSNAADPVDWSGRFYLARPDVPPPSLIAAFGCFSYSNAGNDAIRLHFANTDSRDCSPLSRERIGERRGELRTLFDHVDYTRQTQPAIKRVLGASWLYNLPAYRSLFPSSYIETARELSSRFQNMPLWGQFLDRHGNVRPDMRARFLERLARQTSLHELAQCFPWRALAVDASIALFDGFYRAH
ncbi:hypothetical protein [Paraburkholderia phymatum]|uniref:Uncharacterized protein n=1 Tax=Paraburkholderia phymatum (strain DSM 17167 / CIP 108236 / LMG 21445 / STM815) TaxID=391038 RepID=B2JM72_PARP8|nr:hypothetical protein [Paraburkholderia phymatum]ACC72762.1 conserved hypothetical protein [Paraburkholderia phymatum STM815]